jgi:hypothetical protein
MEISWSSPAPPIFDWFVSLKRRMSRQLMHMCSVNKALRGKWASLACHETGSLVVQVRDREYPFVSRTLIRAQHAFENLEESAKDGIVDELLNRGPGVFADVAKNQWGSYCIQHSSFPVYLILKVDPVLRFLCLLVLEHGLEKHREVALSHLLTCLLDLATSEQGFKSVTKALKEGGKDTLDKFVRRMREAPMG